MVVRLIGGEISADVEVHGLAGAGGCINFLFFLLQA